jgi:hypothetical protein
MHEMNAMHPAAMKVVAFPASSVLAALVCDTCGLVLRLQSFFWQSGTISNTGFASGSSF